MKRGIAELLIGGGLCGCALKPPEALPSHRASLALMNVRVIDGSGSPLTTNAVTIEVTGRRITAIYDSKLRHPRADSIIDLEGKVIIPGLFDSHVHLTIAGRMASRLQLQLVVEGGVTSVRDMAGLAPALAQLAPLSMADSSLVPRVYFAALVAGPSWFDDPRAKAWTGDYPLGASPWLRAVTDSSDVRRIVAEAKATGAMAIKIYANLSPQLVRRIAAEARRANMRVWSHSAVFPASPFDVVAASVHSTSHATYDVWAVSDDLPHMSKGTLNVSDFSSDPSKSPRVDSLLRLMRTNGTVLDATLSVLNVRQENHGALGMDPDRTIAWTRGFVHRAHELGVRMVAGTDAMGPGRDFVPVVHSELEDLVKYGGLTPLEAIASATFNAAQLLGVEEDYGTVKVGKVADLLVLDADPSIDIRNTRRPRMVLKGGILLFQRTVR